jgi:hypothetical protein
MRRKLHPLEGATYDVGEDGHVHVVAADGRSGVFTAEGVWLRGELREADAHLCGWIGGPQLPDPRKAGAPGAEE